MRPCVFVATCAIGWLCLRGVAVACSYSPPAPFEIQADPQDVTPPAAPRVHIGRIKRGKEPEREGCGFSGSSCDDTGYVRLDVEGVDAGAESPDIGYVLEVMGQAPDLSLRSERPVAPSHVPGQLLLAFTDRDGKSTTSSTSTCGAWTAQATSRTSPPRCTSRAATRMAARPPHPPRTATGWPRSPCSGSRSAPDAAGPSHTPELVSAAPRPAKYPPAKPGGLRRWPLKGA
jgi:hypothetical protein